MSNQFANQVVGNDLSPYDESNPVFAGDQLVDPRDVIGGPPNTQLWRKTKKGQMVPIRFRQSAPGEHQFPMCVYGIGVEPLTVRNPTQLAQAEKLGYVTHPEQLVPDMMGEDQMDGRSFDVAGQNGYIPVPKEKPPAKKVKAVHKKLKSPFDQD